GTLPICRREFRLDLHRFGAGRCPRELLQQPDRGTCDLDFIGTSSRRETINAAIWVSAARSNDVPALSTYIDPFGNTPCRIADDDIAGCSKIEVQPVWSPDR